MNDSLPPLQDAAPSSPSATAAPLPPNAAESPFPALSPRLRDLASAELPREKFERIGPSSLADAELLALIFGTGTQGLNVIDMSRRLLDRFGSLVALSRLTWKEFQAIPGIGPAKAKHLAACFELGKRLARQHYETQDLNMPEAIAAMLAPEMRSLSQEVLKIVLLNSRLRLIHVEEITRGSVNETLAPPAMVLRPALVHNAFAFVLVHNHPSGDPTPSESDRRLTRRLVEAARSLEIRFLDHLILGMPGPSAPQGYFSFREAGCL